MLYKLEIKSILIRTTFQPFAGWSVCVNIDGSEKGSPDTEKRVRVAPAESSIRSAQVRIGRHRVFGAKDIVAEHPTLGTVVVKAIGLSSKQPEQELYSALAQLIVAMNDLHGGVTYVIAAPDDPIWVRQLLKVPEPVRRVLLLKLWAVSSTGVREILETAPAAN